VKSGAVRKQLHQIWTRDGGICWICKGPVELADASRDHFLPRSKGGKNNIENLKLAHKSCNSRRGNGDVVLRTRKKRGARKSAAINPETRLEFDAVRVRKVLSYITNENASSFKELTEDEKISLQKRDEP
jgi:hypothetical protein